MDIDEESDDLDWAAIEEKLESLESRRLSTGPSASSLTSQTFQTSQLPQASYASNNPIESSIGAAGDALDASADLFSDEYDFEGDFLEDAYFGKDESKLFHLHAEKENDEDSKEQLLLPSSSLVEESRADAPSIEVKSHSIAPVTKAPENKADMSRIDIGDKAGLEAVDRNKVSQVIYEMSKNSGFYRNEQRKNQKTQEKIEELLEAKSKLGPPDQKLKAWVEDYITSLEANRDLTQTWVHVDMDAFYASVEIRDNPSLKGKPVAVGDTYMISTSSYEARKFGVRSAMPGFIGRQLCPELIFVKPNFKKYEAASEITRQIYSIYDPNYEPLSLDEAGLNITEYLKNNPDKTWEDVVEEIRRLVFERTQLTCSCGIGCNRRLAKLGADINKPNGYFRIESTRESILSYIRPLPVRKLWGVGKVTEQLLNGVGVKTVDDLFRDRYLIAQLFSEISFKWFLSSCLGIGGEQHSEEQGRKSVGRQRTFQRESAPAALFDHLSYVCKLVSKDLVEENLKAKCITLVTKSATFQLKTRAKTISKYLSGASEIFEVAKGLLEAALPIELRLIGVRMTHFENEIEEAAEGTKPITKFFQKTTKEELQKQVEVKLSSLKGKPTDAPSAKATAQEKSLQAPPKNSVKSFFKEATQEEFHSRIEKEVSKTKKRDRSEADVIDLTQGDKAPEPPLKKQKADLTPAKGTLFAMIKRPSF